jgi:3-oxoacyl-[acyl-carrier-protein] synthase III
MSAPTRGTQRYDGVVISGLAHLDAPHTVTSAEIEAQLASTLERLAVAPGLLESLSGVRERRIWDAGTRPSEAAARAAELALADAGLHGDEIGVLINTSVCRDFIEPSTASLVHGRLGLAPTAGNFDLGSACLGFLNGMNLVAAMIERGEIDHGLIVDAETSSFCVDSTIARLASDRCDQAMFREQFATLTLGSGAVAMVMSRSDAHASTHRYLGGLSRSATQHAGLCTGHPDEMKTDTKALLLAGLELCGSTWKEALTTFEWEVDSIHRYAVHQVSRVHTSMVAEVLGIQLDRIPVTFPTFGNIGPAGAPTVLSKAVADGSVVAGNQIVLLGVGSGLNAAIAEVMW